MDRSEMSIPVTAADAISAIARVKPPAPQPMSRTRWPASILAQSIRIGTQKAMFSSENRALKCSVGSCAEPKATGSRMGQTYHPGYSAASVAVLAASRLRQGEYIKSFRKRERPWEIKGLHLP
jgi:hypothetical protein